MGSWGRNDSRADSLTFPNPSRSYVESDHGVRFWGYDRTFEISFLVDRGALSKIDPRAEPDEAGSLSTFDVNRDRIIEAAGGVYARRPKSSRAFSYTLTGSDF